MALCILLYSDVSTYVGLYGSGLLNFGSYSSLPTLFACFWGFDVHTLSFIFILNVFLIFLFPLVFFMNDVNIFCNTGVSYISYEIIQS